MDKNNILDPKSEPFSIKGIWVRLYLLFCGIQSHGRVPRSFQEECKGLSPSHVHAGVNHMLHQDRAFSFQHLQDVQVDGEEGTVQDIEEGLVAPASKFWILERKNVKVVGKRQPKETDTD
jgi:hypothetical protein